MSKYKEIIGLVPVKGNSERVSKKNLRRFANTTLLDLKLNELSKSKGFEKIIVSSENDEVLSTAKKKGFDVHERNAIYSTS